MGANVAQAALLAGLAYPLVFGGLGGVLAAREAGGEDAGVKDHTGESSDALGPRNRR